MNKNSLEEFYILNALVNGTEFNEKPLKSDTFKEIRNIIGSDDVTWDEFIAGRSNYSDRLEYLKSNINSLDCCQPLSDNLKKIGNEAHLDDSSLLILKYLIIHSENEHISRLYEGAFGRLVTKHTHTRIMAECLNVQPTEISHKMSKKGQLCICGILYTSTYSPRSDDLPSTFELNNNLKNSLYSGIFEDKEYVLESFYKISKKTKLTVNNFKNSMNANLDIAISLAKSKSANVLIYGSPGAGKSECVRAIAKYCKLNLFEIASDGNFGDTYSPKERLSVYKTAQYVLKKSNDSLILFDEIDGSFDYGSQFETDNFSKAWVNDILDLEGVPAFWIINDVSRIDPAFLRRFDVIIEMKPMDESTRKKITLSYAKKHKLLIDKKRLETTFKHNQLTPGIIERAIKTVSGSKSDKLKNSENLIVVLNSTLKACGLDEIKTVKKVSKNKKYDVSFSNTDVSLVDILRGLAKNKKGLLCLYGAPGTGKTEFAKHIAERAGMGLLQKKVSDIVSSYVGTTEKNIARAFDDAKKSNSVLLFDEADSFLRDRNQAKNSWEVTEVNELLVQMENFDGLFIATTNIMEGLDPASIRRFGMKVKFDWMLPVQCEKMLQMMCVGRASKDAISQVRRMKTLAPGDFSAVLRHLNMLGKTPTSIAIVDALKIEVSLKRNVGSGSPIGFC